MIGETPNTFRGKTWNALSFFFFFFENLMEERLLKRTTCRGKDSIQMDNRKTVCEQMV